MNALILEKIVGYREKYRLPVSKLLISAKIEYQFAVVGKRKNASPYIKEIKITNGIDALLLIEARAAKEYWKFYGAMIQNKLLWKSRKARAPDIPNKLLDIGYHHLIGKTIRVCQEIRLPTELGFFHKAQAFNAHPLVYDFVEWIRPVIVDRVLLRFVRRKKMRIGILDKKLVSHFLYQVNKNGSTLYFHRKLGYCISLDYWLRLILLQFMKSVNEMTLYKPILPSLRHETRCKKPLRQKAKR